MSSNIIANSTLSWPILDLAGCVIVTKHTMNPGLITGKNRHNLFMVHQASGHQVCSACALPFTHSRPAIKPEKNGGWTYARSRGKGSAEPGGAICGQCGFLVHHDCTTRSDVYEVGEDSTVPAKLRCLACAEVEVND